VINRHLRAYFAPNGPGLSAYSYLLYLNAQCPVLSCGLFRSFC